MTLRFIPQYGRKSSGYTRRVPDQERGRGMRADARLNRERIVAAARELVAEHGPDTTTEAVARRARVGIGTVYRHFPDRAALVRALALDSFQRVVDLARTAEDEEPTAWAALSRFVLDAADELRLATWLSIWFASTWDELRADPENRRLRRLFLAILDRVVRRAQHEGALRADVAVDDVALLLAALLRPIPGIPPAEAQRSARRHLVLALDGLRAGGPASPLPEQGVRIARTRGDD